MVGDHWRAWVVNRVMPLLVNKMLKRQPRLGRDMKRSIAPGCARGSWWISAAHVAKRRLRQTDRRSRKRLCRGGEVDRHDRYNYERTRIGAVRMLPQGVTRRSRWILRRQLER